MLFGKQIVYKDKAILHIYRDSKRIIVNENYQFDISIVKYWPIKSVVGQKHKCYIE